MLSHLEQEAFYGERRYKQPSFFTPADSLIPANCFASADRSLPLVLSLFAAFSISSRHTTKSSLI